MKNFRIRTPYDTDKDFLSPINDGLLGNFFEKEIFTPKETNKFFKEFINNLKPMSIKILEITLKVIKWAAIIAGILLGLLFLGIVTKGRFFNFLLYISLLGAGVFIAFIVPVLIASKIADIYQKVDRNPERGYIVGNFIRCTGFFEGMRSAVGQLHNHDIRPNEHHRFRRF